MPPELFKKVVGYLRGYLLRLRVEALGPIKVYGSVRIKGRAGRVIIGARTKLFPNVLFDFEAAPAGTKPLVRIGAQCHIGDRTEIHCGSEIIMGDRVNLSWDVLLLGSDYHQTDGSDARPEAICIEDDAWVFARATILPGVRIGRGALIGACAVVTRDVPAYAVVVGNPGRVVRMLAPRGGRAASTGP